MVRRVFAALLLAALCAAMLALPQMLRGGLLFPGAQRYLFYAGGASSQARMVFASAAEAPLVRALLVGRSGESACYADAESAFAQAERYGARLLFC